MYESSCKPRNGYRSDTVKIQNENNWQKRQIGARSYELFNALFLANMIRSE